MGTEPIPGMKGGGDLRSLRGRTISPAERARLREALGRELEGGLPAEGIMPMPGM